MSAKNYGHGGKKVAVSNVYTAILAIAFCIVVATAAFIAYTCYSQYGTFFKIP